MNVSRRWFLIGSAVAVGAAAVGLPTLEVSAFVAPLKRAVGHIKVYDISVMPNPRGFSTTDKALVFEVRRAVRPTSSLWSIPIHPRASFRWTGFATPLLFPLGDALLISCTPDPGGDAVATIGYVDLEHQHFIDRFEWRNGVATIVDSQPYPAPSFFDGEDDS